MAATLVEEATLHRLWYDLRNQSLFDDSYRVDVTGREPDAGGRAQRQPGHVRPVHAGGVHERGDVVGEQFRAVAALRLAGQAGAAQVHGEAGEALSCIRPDDPGRYAGGAREGPVPGPHGGAGLRRATMSPCTFSRWIDATSRRPDLRAARIAEVVDLLAAGIKQRSRSPQPPITRASQPE